MVSPFQGSGLLVTHNLGLRSRGCLAKDLRRIAVEISNMHTMDIKPLPIRSGLDRYQEQAQALLEAVQAQNPNAIGHVRRFHPRLAGRANTNDRNKITRQDIEQVQVFLSDTEDVVAGWYGFK